MGQKRKASTQMVASVGPGGHDSADARLGPINSYQDVADSEDDYWIKQDMILLDNDPEPRAKRRKQWEQRENALEDEEEEVLGFEDTDDDDNASVLERIQANLKRKSKRKTLAPEEQPLVEESDEDGDKGWQGATKDEYYDADVIETEEAALAEEKEVLRLEQNKLSKMTEADFVFDQEEWAGSSDNAKDVKVVTENLGDVGIIDSMTTEERNQLLKERYPEFDCLVTEFEELQPHLADFRKDAEGKPWKSFEVVKYWIAGCYVTALASYFAILTSPARDELGGDRPLEPDELRNHEVIEYLVRCRKGWMKVKSLRSKMAPQPEKPPPPPPTDNRKCGREDDINNRPNKTSPSGPLDTENSIKPESKKAPQMVKQTKEVQDAIADLELLPKVPRKVKKTAKSASEPAVEEDKSDFGEEEVMDSKYAAEKAAHKKSLRFYTSQIAQKSNRRTSAGRNFGGDMDIPYRERLKDRQARFTAKAQKHGSKAGAGADLDSESPGDRGQESSSRCR